MLSKKKNTEKILSTILFLFVPIFFVTLYIIMVESYEDINMRAMHSGENVGFIINYVYHYVPRIGEFYQQIAAKFMTNTVSFGPDLLFRLVTALIAWLSIYFTTVFTIGHKISMKYKDVLVYLLFFILIMLLPVSETYTYRFSFVNNYATCIFVTMAFFCFYRINFKKIKLSYYPLIVLFGFLTAISTELIPVIFLFLCAVYFIYQLCIKKNTIKEIIQSHKLQLFGILGIIFGLMFFYMGEGLEFRTSGMYAVLYDYLAPKTFFSNPLGFSYRYYMHVWYNLRYISWMFILDLIIIISSWVLVKKKMYDIKSFTYQVILSVFGTLYLLGASLITIHDELYMRFLSPMYIFFFIIVVLYIMQMVKIMTIKQIVFYRLSIAGIILASVMFADMSYGYIKYHNRVMEDAQKINVIPKQNIVVGDINPNNAGDMRSTPIFRWKTLSPFNWGDDTKYTKFFVNK